MQKMSGVGCFQNRVQDTLVWAVALFILLSSNGFAAEGMPYGNCIVHNETMPELCVISTNGDFLEQLTDNTAEESHPTVSPDGRAFAFNGIYMLKSKDKLIRPLGNLNALRLYRPEWSPRGNEILAENVRSALVSAGTPTVETLQDIYLVDSKSGEGTNLTNTPNLNESNAVWSPDGMAMAFLRYKEGDSSASVCMRKMPDGEDRVVMLSSPSNLSIAAVYWTHDGKSLSILCGYGPTTELWVHSLGDNTDRLALKRPQLQIFANPNANGELLIATDNPQRTHWVEEGGCRLLELGIEVRAACWMPDGKSVLCSIFRRNNEGTGRNSIEKPPLITVQDDGGVGFQEHWLTRSAPIEREVRRTSEGKEVVERKPVSKKEATKLLGHFMKPDEIDAIYGNSAHR